MPECYWCDLLGMQCPRRSQGMTTRAGARRRRRDAESGRLEKRTRADPAASGPHKWRDWANLASDLVGEIAGQLLSVDVAEYLRFRAVCKPWRDLTDDPNAHGVLDSRFRPRDWMVLAITPDAGPRRRLVNLATAASIGVDLPALSAHCHMCSADGLLVLVDRATRAIRLLDPLTGALTDFPAFTVSNVVAAVPPVKPEYVSAVFRSFPWGGTSPYAIDGAGIDDSTSPPTLLLCLRNSLSNIIFAKPGDDHWTTLVSQGDAFFPQYEREGKVLYHSLLSFHGRCYVTTLEGSVYAVELSPLPRLARIVQQQRDVCPYRYRHQAYVCSFLAIAGPSDDDGDHGRRRRRHADGAVLEKHRQLRRQGSLQANAALHGARRRHRRRSSSSHRPHRGAGGRHLREEATPHRRRPRPPRGVRRPDALRRRLDLHRHVPLRRRRRRLPELRDAVPSHVQHLPHQHQSPEETWISDTARGLWR